MREAAERFARTGGEVLVEYGGRLAELDVAYKGTVDLVTAADHEAERRIVAAIAAEFPDHAILAEESERGSGTEGPRWVIDPLDGTTNFVHGFPLYAVSVGFEVDGRAEAGAVYVPTLGEMFSAERERGATLNGRAIHVSGCDDLIRSLLATGFAYDRWERERNNLEEFSRLTMATQGVRRGGAAAIDLAFVAAGRFDGYWEFGLQPWDVSAGALLVTEAGGRVTTIDGHADGWQGGESILATNAHLFDGLREALAGS